jgi:hypothetical protein
MMLWRGGLLHEVRRQCEQAGGAGRVVIGAVVDLAVADAEVVVVRVTTM